MTADEGRTSMAIRNSCKALIEVNGKFLLNHYLHEDGTEYYDLPGGGQRQYETLSETVIRECREETGYEVEIQRLGALREEIYDDPEIRQSSPDYSHRVHFIYLTKPVNPIRWEATQPDRHQIGCRWIGLDEMDQFPIRMPELVDMIREILDSSEILYMEPIHRDSL